MAICGVCGIGFDGERCPKCGGTASSRARCSPFGILCMQVARWFALLGAILMTYFTLREVHWRDEWFFGMMCGVSILIQMGLFYAFSMAVKYGRGE